MKHINTNHTGRMPLWQADLDWMQKGWAEPMEALIAELGMADGYFIITGCSPYMVGNRICMDAGWFWWNGRILPVRRLEPALTNSFDNPVVRLTLVNYNDPRGARQFTLSDLTTQQVGDVWQDDYLTPTVVERSAYFPSGVRLGVGAWTLSDIIANRAAGGESEWIGGTMQYKRIGRIVVLRGVVTNNATFDGMPVPLVPTSIPTPNGVLNISRSGQLEWIGTQEDRIEGLTYVAATTYQPTDPNTINDNATQGGGDNPEQQ